MTKPKTVWLVDVFDCQMPTEPGCLGGVKAAFNRERAAAYAMQEANEYRQWLLDEEYSDDEIEPVINQIGVNQLEVVDANDEQRYLISWHEVEVV